MPEANATIQSQSMRVHPEEGRFGAQTINPMSIRKTEGYVYIHTISDKSFTLHRPPLLPTVVIPARKQGERSSLALKLPHPMQQADAGIDTSDMVIRLEDARAVAADVCNPDNPFTGGDALSEQNRTISPERVMSSGENLTQQGVFWSLNEKPTEAEISAAEQRREQYFRQLLEQARVLEMGNPGQLAQIMNADYHMAADHFGVETTWHRKGVSLASCPNCGESIKPNVAYHKNSMGMICIIDRPRAEAAGVVPKE